MFLGVELPSLTAWILNHQRTSCFARDANSVVKVNERGVIFDILLDDLLDFLLGNLVEFPLDCLLGILCNTLACCLGWKSINLDHLPREILLQEVGDVLVRLEEEKSQIRANLLVTRAEQR